MTRETKIGLLVGLAFIIVVGILLSEHLSTTTERPSAPLAEAGRGVRAGSAAPGDLPPAMPAESARAQVQQPIVTASDFAASPLPQSPPAQPAGTAQVSIGGPIALPSGTSPTIIVVQGDTLPQPTAIASTETVVTRLPEKPSNDPFANDPIFKSAQAQGELLVPSAGPTNVAVDFPGPPNVTQTKAREYKAQPGDTLSRIAALLPGGSTKANRDAIVKLNPTLQKDPNKIIAGRAYLLPTGTANTQQAAAQSPGKPAEPLVDATQLPRPAQPESQSTGGVRVYVVQPGDSLTRIASRELGSKSHLEAIRKLNEDVLKGSDVIRVDMKLKLPAKVASID